MGVQPLFRLRHSAFHILAQAVLALYPGTKRACISGDTVNFGQNGPFTDLCEGGDVKNADELNAFKHFSLAGA